MIVTTINSGLGNQMFQYAAGFSLARLHNTRLALDTQFYQRSTSRTYELGRLSISGKPFSMLDRARIKRSSIKAPTTWKQKLITRLPIGRLTIVFDRNVGFDPAFLKLPDNTLISGYWQCVDYFRHCDTELRQEFRFRTSPDDENQRMLDKIQSKASVCLHVRRGDYLNAAEVVGPCGLDYYERSIRAMQSWISDAHYFVFSDDPEWAKANLRLPGNATYVTHNTGTNDPEDLRLMSACDHFIIANSTFSWWGAWLSESAGKRVIAPARWFKAEHGDEQSIVPPEWVRL